jgi:enoyl-CoA hydratase/carnithine racemase
VLTGGAKLFSAGFDIKELLAAQPGDAVPRNTRLMAVYNAIETGPLPVIAAINGYALGGACELAMACDIRIAAADAKLGLPEIKLGGVPGIGGMARLVRLVGLGKAKQIVLSGEQITASEAHRVGLVDELAPAGGAVAVAIDLARTIASRAPLSVRSAKRALNSGRDLSLAKAQGVDLQAVGEVAVTEDRAECLRAFVEKRPPDIVGR